MSVHPHPVILRLPQEVCADGPLASPLHSSQKPQLRRRRFRPLLFPSPSTGRRWRPSAAAARKEGRGLSAEAEYLPQSEHQPQLPPSLPLSALAPYEKRGRFEQSPHAAFHRRRERRRRFAEERIRETGNLRSCPLSPEAEPFLVLSKKRSRSPHPKLCAFSAVDSCASPSLSSSAFFRDFNSQLQWKAKSNATPKTRQASETARCSARREVLPEEEKRGWADTHWRGRGQECGGQRKRGCPRRSCVKSPSPFLLTAKARCTPAGEELRAVPGAFARSADPPAVWQQIRSVESPRLNHTRKGVAGCSSLQGASLGKTETRPFAQCEARAHDAPVPTVCGASHAERVFRAVHENDLCSAAFDRRNLCREKGEVDASLQGQCGDGFVNVQSQKAAGAAAQPGRDRLVKQNRGARVFSSSASCSEKFPPTLLSPTQRAEPPEITTASQAVARNCNHLFLRCTPHSPRRRPSYPFESEARRASALRQRPLAAFLHPQEGTALEHKSKMTSSGVQTAESRSRVSTEIPPISLSGRPDPARIFVWEHLSLARESFCEGARPLSGCLSACVEVQPEEKKIPECWEGLQSQERRGGSPVSSKGFSEELKGEDSRRGFGLSYRRPCQNPPAPPTSRVARPAEGPREALFFLESAQTPPLLRRRTANPAFDLFREERRAPLLPLPPSAALDPQKTLDCRAVVATPLRDTPTQGLPPVGGLPRVSISESVKEPPSSTRILASPTKKPLWLSAPSLGQAALLPAVTADASEGPLVALGKTAVEGFFPSSSAETAAVEGMQISSVCAAPRLRLLFALSELRRGEAKGLVLGSLRLERHPHSQQRLLGMLQDRVEKERSPQRRRKRLLLALLHTQEEGPLSPLPNFEGTTDSKGFADRQAEESFPGESLEEHFSETRPAATLPTKEDFPQGAFLRASGGQPPLDARVCCSPSETEGEFGDFPQRQTPPAHLPLTTSATRQPRPSQRAKRGYRRRSSRRKGKSDVRRRVLQ